MKRWFGMAAWAVLHWRTVVVGAVLGLAAIGVLLFALGLATAPGGGSQLLMVLGILIAGTTLLRLPAILRFARRRALTSSRAIRVRKASMPRHGRLPGGR